VSDNEKTSSGKFPYKLHISRIDNVDFDSVDEYVLDLWEFANECNGDYDGWETSIEKE
jgi:regulator of RNase E activity RraB